MEDPAAALPAEAIPVAARRSALTPDALCDAYAGRVFKFAQFLSTDASAAEDLAQDALERAIRGLSSFDPDRGQIEAWLWRIVVNAARDAGRIARRQQLLQALLIDQFSRRQANHFSADQASSDEVLAAVRSLGARHRAAIALRYGADLAYRDVGRALGISEGAAQMTTRRALALLRVRLSGGVQIR